MVKRVWGSKWDWSNFLCVPAGADKMFISFLKYSEGVYGIGEERPQESVELVIFMIGYVRAG